MIKLSDAGGIGLNCHGFCFITIVCIVCMDTTQRNSPGFKPHCLTEQSGSTDVNISVKTASSPLNTHFNRLGFVLLSQMGGKR